MTPVHKTYLNPRLRFQSGPFPHPDPLTEGAVQRVANRSLRKRVRQENMEEQIQRFPEDCVILIGTFLEERAICFSALFIEKKGEIEERIRQEIQEELKLIVTSLQVDKIAADFFLRRTQTSLESLSLEQLVDKKKEVLDLLAKFLDRFYEPLRSTYLQRVTQLHLALPHLGTHF